MNLFFDFDGTLVDSSDRHYMVYSKIVLSLGGIPLAKIDYWDLIRSKTDKSIILDKSQLENVSSEKYLAKFIAEIEKKENLACEKLVNHQVLKTLEILKAKHKLFLITLRQNKAEALAQVEDLGLGSYFYKVIICQSGKVEAIKPYLEGECFLIGDTELDIETAKSLGIKSVAVLSGFRTKEFLERYNPDFIIKNINYLERII